MRRILLPHHLDVLQLADAIIVQVVLCNLRSLFQPHIVRLVSSQVNLVLVGHIVELRSVLSELLLPFLLLCDELGLMAHLHLFV